MRRFGDTGTTLCDIAAYYTRPSEDNATVLAEITSGRTAPRFKILKGTSLAIVEQLDECSFFVVKSYSIPDGNILAFRDLWGNRCSDGFEFDFNVPAKLLIKAVGFRANMASGEAVEETGPPPGMVLRSGRRTQTIALPATRV